METLLFYYQVPYLYGNRKEKKMSWDEAYKQLQQELGREPNSGEVQKRMLEIAEQKTQNEQSH